MPAIELLLVLLVVALEGTLPQFIRAGPVVIPPALSLSGQEGGEVKTVRTATY